jgi:hypothetical protein
MHTFKEYADLVKKEHALNKTIAPNETGTTASKAYSVGDHFIRNGILYKVTTAIASGATWANISSSYTPDSNISSQIQNLSNQTKRNAYGSSLNKLKMNTLLYGVTDVSGGTFTRNSDNTVIVNVTDNTHALVVRSLGRFTLVAGKKYKILGGYNKDTCMITIRNLQGGNWSNNTVSRGVQSPVASSTVDEFIANSTEDVLICVRIPASNVINNAKLYPMIIDMDVDSVPSGNIEDYYVPFYDSSRELTDDVTALITNLNANGCKNLCVIANRAGTTHNSVTWAVADDDAITCDGTVPSGKYSNFPLCTLKFKKGVTYRVVMIREGTQTGTGDPYPTLNQGNSAVFTGNGTYTPTDDITLKVQLNISPTKQVTTSAKYYVLVCRESDYQLSSEFNLGAKSNRQLTEDIATINGHGYTLLGNGNAQSGNTTFPAEQMTNIQCYADTVLRRAFVRFTALVSSKALTKGSAIGVCNCYNGYVAKDPVMNNFGYAEKDGNIYLFLLGKSTSGNIIALTPLDDIPSGATFKGTLEWYY